MGVEGEQEEEQKPALPEVLEELKGHKIQATQAARRAEFWTLGVEANAAILARLCDDLLNSGPIRSEIDRREAAGCHHTGRGGMGGFWAMRIKSTTVSPGCFAA
jgi:hypothetical protein